MRTAAGSHFVPADQLHGSTPSSWAKASPAQRKTFCHLIHGIRHGARLLLFTSDKPGNPASSFEKRPGVSDDRFGFNGFVPFPPSFFLEIRYSIVFAKYLCIGIAFHMQKFYFRPDFAERVIFRERIDYDAERFERRPAGHDSEGKRPRGIPS